MSDDLKFSLSFGCAILILFVLILGGVLTADYYKNRYACYKRWPNHKPQYEFWLGCTIETADGWRLPSTNYRVIE